MRMFKYLGILLVLLLPSLAGANDLGLARLSLIDGDVQVLIQDTTDWTPATINLPMNEHDRIWVADSSRAELQIQGGVYARTEGNSSLDILTINRDSAQFYLDQGHLYINNRRGGINTVQIDTSLASIRSYDNSIMMVDVAESGEIEISVLKGVAYAESRAGSTSVSAGNTLTIRGESNAEISPISAPDQWEEWNIARDREVNSWSESSRYLPDELHEYSSDFDQYGRWDYDSEYGYVWSPVVIGADWAPYSYGNWVWIRGSYVWIDYDPWGWAPSHYGRWVFGARGWCWVPPAAGAVYWGPGYVGWVVTPSYVAWVPLAPGETYYGYGYYGPHSVNIATVNVNTVVVNRNYRNAVVRNSVVVVNRDSFGTGRRVPARIRENPFENRGRQSNWQNVTVVPPKVRPDKPVVVAPLEARQHTRQMIRERDQRVRESRSVAPLAPPASTADRPEQRQPRVVAPHATTPVPQTQPVPQNQQQPPERIRRNRPQDVKNARPLVRQREASVFQPRQPDNLPVTRSNQPKVINRVPQQHTQQGGQGRGQQQRQQRQQQEERGHGR